jgi:hypothetical protein
MKSLTRCMIVSGLILASHAIAFGQIYPDPAGKLNVKYDRFSDESMATLDFLQVTENDHDRLYLTLYTKFTGEKPSKPADLVLISFSSWSLYGYTLSSEKPLYSIIDGVRTPLGTLSPLKAMEVNGKYVSSLVGQLDQATFMKLVKAKKIEMKLGDFEFSLTDQQLQRIHDFASRIQP